MPWDDLYPRPEAMAELVANLRMKEPRHLKLAALAVVANALMNLDEYLNKS